MTTIPQHGSPQFPTLTEETRQSTVPEMDAAIQALQTHKDAWVALSIRERIMLLDTLIKDFDAIAPQWVALSCEAKGISSTSPLVGEEWSIGPLPLLKNLRQLRQSLIDIATHGSPRIPGPITTRPDGQVVAQVFPQTVYDRLFFMGVTAEVWMEPGITREGLAKTQAQIYQDTQHEGKVVLVLGAGNVSSIAPTDVLYKLFVEDKVVLLKMNPINAYLGPLIVESFRALVDRGFLRVTYGGAHEGSYLCNHADIEEIHITGSDKTFDAITFGNGPEGATRKAERKPLLHKPITGELGNVSPLIVVPGPWSQSDLAYQGEHIVTSLTTNAGFNCNASRIIIQHASWEQREPLLQQIRHVLQQLPTRDAYYPGAHERQGLFLTDHPDAIQIGSAQDKRLPWTLIADVDPAQTNDICFTTEAFCGLFAETKLEAASVAQYIDRAVDFANQQVWGSLCATILVHPKSLRDPEVAQAIERAVAHLRYGTIGVNYWGGTGFALAATPWGAYPGHAIDDIQSGVGVVHNTLMFAQSQKAVVRGPFRSTPTPPWFALHDGRAVFPKVADIEATPALWKIPGVLWSALQA